MPAAPVLDIRGLAIAAGRHRLIDRVALAAAKGEILCLGGGLEPGSAGDGSGRA